MSNQSPRTLDCVTEPAPSRVGVWLGRILRSLLVLIILGAGASVAIYYMKNKPKADRKPPEDRAALVEAQDVIARPHTVVVHAMGIVMPARTTQLAARVGGELIDVDSEFADAPSEFVPGGRFLKGQRILQIDPEDYRLVVLQRTAELARSRSSLKLEMGQQSVALREYELLGEDVAEADKELLLREPQLAAAKAAEAIAQAALDRAELDLKRSKVTAPFNAAVQSRSVNLGSQVRADEPLAVLVGTDKYWVRVSVPVDELRWIKMPDAKGAGGSAVRVYCKAAWDNDEPRAGVVERVMTDLEPEGLMARLLVAVSDPLDLNSGPERRRPLLLGSQVSVEIDGRTLADAARVPRTALRDGDRIWLIGSGDKLVLRNVRIAWGDKENVYITEDLAAGDRLVTSDLAAPVAGMALRILPKTNAKDKPVDANKAKVDDDGRPEATQ